MQLTVARCSSMQPAATPPIPPALLQSNPSQTPPPPPPPVPAWSGPSLARPFRGSRGFDGGFSRQLPCPPGVTYCVTVSVIPPYLSARQMIGVLLESTAVKVIRGMLTTTMGSSLVKFVTDVVMPMTTMSWKLEEVVLSSAAYASAIMSVPPADIWPGERLVRGWLLLCSFAAIWLPVRGQQGVQQK
jgi:hypothetical protein